MNPVPALVLFCTTLLLAACHSGPSPEEQRAARLAARMEAEAETRLKHLGEMRAIGRDDLALNFAEDILQRFPQTRAAIQVKPLAEELRASVAAAREQSRLSELWVYHNGHDAEAGGVVRTAYLFSSNTLGDAEAGKDAPKSRLVLRRHPQWGDDVYLLSERGNFRCGAPCTVELQFDGGDWVTYPASLPATGEPAMFVEDFPRFVSTLPGKRELRARIALADGSRHEPWFEVGGYKTDTIGSP